MSKSQEKISQKVLRELFQQPRWIELETLLTRMNQAGHFDCALTVSFVEVVFISNALKVCQFNQSQAARLLNMNRGTFRKKMKTLQLWANHP